MVYALIGRGSHKRNSLSHPVRVGKPQEGRFQVKECPDSGLRRYIPALLHARGACANLAGLG